MSVAITWELLMRAVTSESSFNLRRSAVTDVNDDFRHDATGGDAARHLTL